MLIIDDKKITFGTMKIWTYLLTRIIPIGLTWATRGPRRGLNRGRTSESVQDPATRLERLLIGVPARDRVWQRTFVSFLSSFGFSPAQDCINSNSLLLMYRGHIDSLFRCSVVCVKVWLSPLLPLSNQHSDQCALQFTMCGVHCATVM